MTIRILTALTILLYSAFGYGQSVIDSSVQEILKGDSISLQVHRVGCFSGRTATTTIIKQSTDSFFVTCRDFLGYVSHSKIDMNKLLDFARLFSYEMKRKPTCICTTSDNFTLKTGKKEVRFQYRCCGEKNPPNKSFLISLGLSE